MNNVFLSTYLYSDLAERPLCRLPSKTLQQQRSILINQINALNAFQNFQSCALFHSMNSYLLKKANTFDENRKIFDQNLQKSTQDFIKFEQKDALKPNDVLLKTEHQAQGQKVFCSFDLKTQITDMVKYFIDEFNNNDQTKIEQQRKKYFFNKTLVELFDALRQKYSATWKCREDMLRLALRKALSFSRDLLREQLNISTKEASLELCKRYFGTRIQDFVKEEEGNQMEILSYLFPYKKNSIHSTPNTSFVHEIFASDAFNEDYIRFLSKFDELQELDNLKRIHKLVAFLMDCVQKNTLYKVKTFKRLPWLRTWMQATKIVATEIFDRNGLTAYKSKTMKRTKD